MSTQQPTGSHFAWATLPQAFVQWYNYGFWQGRNIGYTEGLNAARAQNPPVSPAPEEPLRNRDVAHQEAGNPAPNNAPAQASPEGRAFGIAFKITGAVMRLTLLYTFLMNQHKHAAVYGDGRDGKPISVWHVIAKDSDTWNISDQLTVYSFISTLAGAYIWYRIANALTNFGHYLHTPA